MTTSPDFTHFATEAHQRRPRVALILGSGLGHLADHLGNVCELPFRQAPELEAPSVTGHRGALVLGDWAGRTVLMFSGRLHAYEGHPWRRVVQPVHIARELGADLLLVTNAAGGIRDDLNPGDLLAIRAHIDLTRPDFYKRPLPSEPSPYSPRLIERLQAAAAAVGMSLPVGVYAQVTGPSYETPAEIRALRALGADAVGMSTGREVQAAFELGLECAAVSCITNKAAGLGTGPVNHEEVLATAAARRSAFAVLIENFVRDAPLAG